MTTELRFLDLGVIVMCHGNLSQVTTMLDPGGIDAASARTVAVSSGHVLIADSSDNNRL